MTTLTISAARQDFLNMPERVQDEPVLVTRHGKPVLAVMSAEQLDGLLETLEILRDQAFATKLRKSMDEAEAGKTVSMAAVKARFGIQ